jgi:hypothetical protein
MTEDSKPDKVTVGEMIDRIRAAYGLPITGTLTDADLKVLDVLNDMRVVGVRVGKGEAGATSPESR